MDELERAKRVFMAALESRSPLPGINDINLATAAVALLRAEEIDPDSEETRCMRAAFAALGRKDAYDRVKAAAEDPQP